VTFSNWVFPVTDVSVTIQVVIISPRWFRVIGSGGFGSVLWQSEIWGILKYFLKIGKAISSVYLFYPEMLIWSVYQVLIVLIVW
jgi:hypothetical protein